MQGACVVAFASAVVVGGAVVEVSTVVVNSVVEFPPVALPELGSAVDVFVVGGGTVVVEVVVGGAKVVVVKH